jgi:Domain of unknown function (DUF4292)
MRRHVGIVFLFLLMNLTAGCVLFKIRSGNNVYNADTTNIKKTIVNDLYNNSNLILNGVSINYSLNGDTKNFDCSIRILKDSLITIIIKSLLGIELFRIYINYDSIFIIDRTHGCYEVRSIVKDFSKFSEFITVNNMKDFILGEISENSKYKKYPILVREEKFSKFGIIEDLLQNNIVEKREISYIIDNSSLKLKEFIMNSNLRRFHFIYNDYQIKNNMLFPGKIEIEMQSKTEKCIISIEIAEIKIIRDLLYNISIPNGYKRVI